MMHLFLLIKHSKLMKRFVNCTYHDVSWTVFTVSLIQYIL